MRERKERAREREKESMATDSGDECLKISHQSLQPLNQHTHTPNPNCLFLNCNNGVSEPYTHTVHCHAKILAPYIQTCTFLNIFPLHTDIMLTSIYLQCSSNSEKCCWYWNIEMICNLFKKSSMV